MGIHPSAHRGFPGERHIMSNTHMFTNTAIAALAGLTVAAMSTTALGATQSIGSTGAPQAPITKGEIESTPLALEAEDGANSNDVFESHTDIQAPNDLQFDIVGELSKSDADGVCRDVDFIQITGLEPEGFYALTIAGPVSFEAHIGWFTPDGLLILQIVPGITDHLPIVADPNGNIALGVSADSDGDYDGNIDDTESAHEICGKYHIVVENIPNDIPADINGDSLVDISDVRLMLTLIGAVDSPKADLNRDGIVDAADLRMLADAVTDRRARGLAEKKAKKLEQRQIRAERKAAKQTLKAAKNAERAARRR